MAGLMIGVGLLAYAVAGFIIMDAPTITQEIAGFLVATNATLFCVGGMVVMAIEGRRESASSTHAPSARPHAAGVSGAKDDYSQWAERLTSNER